MRRLAFILVGLATALSLYSAVKSESGRIFDTNIENKASVNVKDMEIEKPDNTDMEKEEKQELAKYKEYQTGKASYYGGRWHGRKTANGEIYNQNSMTAAHKSLPFGTKVRVTNLNNGKSVIVRINNRGPYVKGRIIDLSKAAFAKIENLNKGVTKVKLEIQK